MRLNDYLREDLVIHDLDASDREGVLDAVGDRLVRIGLLPVQDEVVGALRAREEVHTTVLGDGVAIPHATLPALEAPVLLLARAPRAIPFGPQGTGPVDLFFVLLSPPGREGEHIKLLARICRLSRHPGFLDELREASDAGGLLRTILRVDAQHV